MVIISPKQADSVSDNDSISLTSTIGSAHSENEFFEVKKILAENPNSKTATFLIQWEGYPVSRATWEPRKQIRHLRSVINEWRQTQKLEQSGIQESFDTAAWAAAREKSEDERQSRKVRRAIKRKRLQKATKKELDWDLDFKSCVKTEKSENGLMTTDDIPENTIKKEPEEKNLVNLLPKSNRNRRKIISDDDEDNDTTETPETTDFHTRDIIPTNLQKSESPVDSFFQARPLNSTEPVIEVCLSPPMRMDQNNELKDYASNPNLEYSSNVIEEPEYPQEDVLEQKVNQNQNDSVKEVVLGADNSSFISLDFGNIQMISENYLKDTIMATKKIHFNQLCIAQDFQSQYCSIKSPVIWQESFTSVDPNDRDTTKKIEIVFNELVIRCAGLLAVVNKFIILMFPVRREEWRFIDQSPEISAEFRLRYSIFSNNFRDKLPIHTETSYEMVSRSPSLFGESRKLLIMKLLDRLIPRYENCQSTCKYFLLFPPSASKMANFVKFCLISYHPNIKVYGSMTEGSWDTFNQTQTLSTASHTTENETLRVVLIHESAITELFRIPNLSIILNNTKTTFWQFSDGSSKHSLYPSFYSPPNLQLGNITATELYPHGCAVFLTPSFLVAEPKSAINFIRWFVAEKIQKHIVPCRFVGAHNLPSFVLDVAKSKASEASSYEKRHAKNPKKKEVLKERFLDYQTCKIRWGLYNELFKLSQYYLNNSGCQKTFESVLLQAPSMINPDNEHELIRWFAAWSLINSDIFRKFLVIGTGLSSTPHAKYLKECPVKNRDSISKLKKQTPKTSSFIPDEVEGLKKGTLDRNLSITLNTQNTKPLSEGASKGVNLSLTNKSLETRISEASRDLSETMNSNPNYLRNTSSNLNTLEPELGFRTMNTPLLGATQNPGSKPFDSEPIVHNRKEKDNLNENLIHKLPVTSKVEEDNKAAHKPAIELKELKFEATTEWYKRLRARGSGWEHVTVTEFSEARKLLEFM
ncbi:putative chromo domain-containing protein [Erysiphe necator]|uniref:Putative chromo domain-containing protein n=1 Tax=Uncinula necator TaxID=52586 RepID=A0A0B1P5F2_UNCNE|nr:putative chromo domain-containing protein [Erysiphe necator]